MLAIAITLIVFVAVFAGITQITIGFGFFWRMVERTTRFFHGLQLKLHQPKPKRYRTYGREFLMLRHKDIRRRCFEGKSWWVKAGLFMMFFNLLLVIVLLFFGRWFDAACIMTSVQALYLLVRKTAREAKQLILLPAYRRHLRTKAQAALESASNEFNDVLPTQTFRGEFLPMASPASLPQLRVLAAGKRLPPVLASKFARIESASREIEEAETCLTEPKNTETKAT